MRWKLAYILALLWVMLCAPAQLWPLTTTNTYNPDNSFATLATPAVATLTYGYDANGNRTGETYSNVPPAVLNKASRSLDYDAQDRLTKQELADGNKQTWTLSAVGNWTQTQLNQDPAQTRTHTATHQIASMAGTALSYDAKGNMTTDQRGYAYRWDHENRLIEVLGPPVVESATTQPEANTTPGSTTQPEDPYADPNAVSTPTSQPATQPTIAWRQTYTYDAMGRRVSRTTYQNEVASTTVYVSAGMQEVAEYTDSSDAAAPSRTYVYGGYVDEPVQVRVFASATTQPASTQNATTQPSYTDYYYHTNALYSVIAVTDTAGTVVERYTYDAYGQRTITDAAGTPRVESILGNEISFTGRRLDPLTNQYYFRARYYDAAQGRFISRDPLEYVDGMSLYGGYYVPKGLDPEGTVVVLIHGVNTKAEWFGNAVTGLNNYWKKSCDCSETIIEFKWGDPNAWGEQSPKQGGHLNYATDNVAAIYSSGSGSKERQYMADAAKRMQDMLNLLNAIKAKNGSKEQISVIAHSQGSILTLAALQKGAQLDNLIIMGSPLDIWPYDKSNNDLLKAKVGVRGKTFNYWSKYDEAAYVKGGIGAHGDELAKIGDLSWITNREFSPGAVINGYTLPSTGDYAEYDHPDYMGKAEFFERIHGPDLGCQADTKISKDASMGRLTEIGRSAW